MLIIFISEELFVLLGMSYFLHSSKYYMLPSQFRVLLSCLFKILSYKEIALNSSYITREYIILGREEEKYILPQAKKWVSSTFLANLYFDDI